MEPRQYRDATGQLGVGFAQPVAGMVSIAWQQTPPARYLIGDLDGYGITEGAAVSLPAPTPNVPHPDYEALMQEIASLKHEIELLTQTNYNLRERIDVLTLPTVAASLKEEPAIEPETVEPVATDVVDADTEAGQIEDTEPTPGHVESETVVTEPDDSEVSTEAVDTEPSEDDLIAAHLTAHGLDVTNKSVIEALRADGVVVQSTQVTRVKERLRAIATAVPAAE